MYYSTPWPGFLKGIKTKNPEMLLSLPKQRATVQMERTFANVAETCAVFASSSSSSFLQRKKYVVCVLSPSMQSQHPHHRSATPPDSQP